MIQNFKKVTVALFVVFLVSQCKMAYPMYNACKNGDVQKVKALIKKGKKINAKLGSEKKTALMIACQKGNLGLVKLLLGVGARVDIQDEDDQTALVYVCKQEEVNLKLLAMLANEGACSRAQIDSVVLAFQKVRSKNIKKVLPYLISGSQKGKRKKAKALFLWACEDDESERVKALIEYGVNVNTQVGLDKKTALMFACQNRNGALIEYLFKKGAQVNLKDEDGKTALMYAGEQLHASLYDSLSYEALAKEEDSDSDYYDESDSDDEENAASLSIVAKLVNRGAKLDAKDNEGKGIESYVSYKNGKTLLIDACQNGYVSLAQKLIQHGVDVNVCGGYEKKTALMIACQKGNLSLVKLLLGVGARVDIQDEDDQTALVYVCKQEEVNLKLLAMLAKEGACIRREIDSVIMAFRKVRDKNIKKVLPYLLSGVQKEKRKKAKELLLYACQDDECEKVKALMGYVSVNTKVGPEKKTALMYVCQNRNERLIEYLLAKGANINLKDEDGKTALMYAAEQLHVSSYGSDSDSGSDSDYYDESDSDEEENTASLSIVAKLVKKGANLNAKDNEGRGIESYVSYKNGKTLLMDACAKGYVQLVQKLIKNGADINAKGGYQKKTALMVACENGNLSLVTLLLGVGARVDIKDEDGKTALGYACDQSEIHTGVLAKLGRYGACVAKEAHNGITAFRYVRDKQIKQVLPYLLTKSARGKKARVLLLCACKSNNFEKVKALIECGLHVNIQVGPEKKTALMYACENNNKTLIGYLLAKGARVNLKDKQGKTALMYACEQLDEDSDYDSDFDSDEDHEDRGGFDIIAQLCKKGARVGAKDNQGNTVLGCALSRCPNIPFFLMRLYEQGGITLLQKFVKNGADINARGGDCKSTLLMAACSKNYVKLVNWLCAHGVHLDLKNSYGRTAFANACFQEDINVKIIKKLIEQGASVSEKLLRNFMEESVSKKVRSYLEFLKDREKAILQINKPTDVKKKSKQLIVFICQEKELMYAKQIALMRLIKYCSSQLKRTFFNQIVFNETYLKDTQAVKFAFKHNLRDKDNNDIIEAMIKYNCRISEKEKPDIEHFLLELLKRPAAVENKFKRYIPY